MLTWCIFWLLRGRNDLGWSVVLNVFCWSLGCWLLGLERHFLLGVLFFWFGRTSHELFFSLLPSPNPHCPSSFLNWSQFPFPCLVHLFHLFYLLFPFYFFSIFVSTFFISVFGPSSSVFLFLLVLAGDDFRALDGDFLPQVTWVHSSFSLLLGWSPVSVVFVLIGVDDIDEAVAVVDTNEAVDVVTVVLMVFCGQDLEKWPICLQCLHCGFRPSTTTIMA